MRDPAQYLTARSYALEAAIELHRPLFNSACAGASREAAVTAVRDTATDLFAWLAGPTHLALHRGLITVQSTGQPSGTPTPLGDKVQIHDNEQFDLSVSATDAKGQPVLGETLTWTVDNPDVVSLQVSADTQTCTVVAGVPGSCVVTVADEAAGLSATEAVDVVAGPVALIQINEGPVSTQP